MVVTSRVLGDLGVPLIMVPDSGGLGRRLCTPRARHQDVDLGQLLSSSILLLLSAHVPPF
jgi:hypothetical protein